jgi:hypothetical protein
MPDTIRVVDYFYLMVPDKPGERVRVLNVLKEAGVNLLAFSGFPGGRRTQLDFFPVDGLGRPPPHTLEPSPSKTVRPLSPGSVKTALLTSSCLPRSPVGVPSMRAVPAS